MHCHADQRRAEALPFTTKKRVKADTADASKPSKALKVKAVATPTKPSTPDTVIHLASPGKPIPFPVGMRHRSLAPLLPNPALGHPAPVLLIVGSAPSEASLAAQCYYAYKYNHFWPIVSALFPHPTPLHSLPYAERVTALVSHGVAVWDVCREFTRKGSLDSNLRSVTPNDFLTLFDAHPTIRLVASNGGTSGSLFRKHVGLAECERRGMRHVILPSSSPAHAMKNAVEEKTRRWRETLGVGDNGELAGPEQGAAAKTVVEQAEEQAEQGDLVEIED